MRMCGRGSELLEIVFTERKEIMDKKMTTGEIAKKVGISQKAVRLYDEKGLLKPSEYSEGNYRLYDAEALLVLEKIIALKQVGFSLEEIKDNLVKQENQDILQTLQSQIDMMEGKKYELEKAIARMKAVIARSNGQPDWDDVAEIIQAMQVDQRADEGHFEALKHNADGQDWYVKIYNSLGVKEGERVLDLGCGFSKVWRNNWKDIPAKVKVDGYDLPESWAEDFKKFVGENKNELAEGTAIDVIFQDVQEEETWANIQEKAPYTMAIAHYIMQDCIEDPEAFVARTAEALAEGGMFSVNNDSVSKSHDFWIDTFRAAGLDEKYATESKACAQAKSDAFTAILSKYFDKIEAVELPSPFCYDSAAELYDLAVKRFPEAKDYLSKIQGKLKAYFQECIERDGNVIIDGSGVFWHCFK